MISTMVATSEAAQALTPIALIPQIILGGLIPTYIKETLGLPVDVKARVSPAVLDRMEVDKKRRSDKVRFVFVPRPGEAVLHDIPLAELKQELQSAI